MAELVLSTSTLPEPLIRLINTDKVKVKQLNGIVSLIPVKESKKGCPLRGLAADSTLTVESFLAMTHDDRELGQ